MKGRHCFSHAIRANGSIRFDLIANVTVYNPPSQYGGVARKDTMHSDVQALFPLDQTAVGTGEAGLTGSTAASWHRCTRLSKVLLRIMCSAGISLCSTRSAGSCWRSCRRVEEVRLVHFFSMPPSILENIFVIFSLKQLFFVDSESHFSPYSHNCTFCIVLVLSMPFSTAVIYLI